MKEKIQSEVYQLFRKYGIKSVTMDDIASHLGVSKKTLYKYYTKKDELVNAIAQMHISGTESKCCTLQVKADNAIHELFLVLSIVREMFSGMNPSMVFDLKKYHKSSWEMLEAHENEFVYNMLVANLNRGIEEGVYRKNLNIEILAKLRILEIK